ncbi:hypothetical protein V8C86DRAFT_3130573 [Haematococcus lacustris]
MRRRGRRLSQPSHFAPSHHLPTHLSQADASPPAPPSAIPPFRLETPAALLPFSHPLPSPLQPPSWACTTSQAIGNSLFLTIIVPLPPPFPTEKRHTVKNGHTPTTANGSIVTPFTLCPATLPSPY